MSTPDRSSGSYRVAFQLVGEVVAVLDEVATFRRGNADPVVASELILRAPRQGQVDPGGVELLQSISTTFYDQLCSLRTSTNCKYMKAPQNPFERNSCL